MKASANLALTQRFSNSNGIGLKIRHLKFSLDPKFIWFPGVFLCVVIVKLISMIFALDNAMSSGHDFPLDSNWLMLNKHKTKQIKSIYFKFPVA